MLAFHLCKNLRVVVRTCPLLELHLLSSLRYMSSKKICKNDLSFTVSYLINSCGLSPESAILASKNVRFNSLTRPDLVLSFLKKHGFSETDITKVVKVSPKVLMSNPEKTFLPKLQFFYSKGFSAPEIVRIVCTNSLLLYRSLENHIIPTYNFLRGVLRSDDKTVAAIKRCHRIIYQSLQTYLERSINVLRGEGVSDSDIVYLLHSYPIIFTVSFYKFNWAVKEARDMGFDPSKSIFVTAVRYLLFMSKSTWEKKVGIYKRWDLSEKEILAAFRKFPDFMGKSEDKIMAVMDLFVNKLGWESSVIAKNPVLVALSLEKRLVPRASVLKFLVSKGLVEKNSRPASLFYYSEGKFLQKFAHRFHEAPEILKLYAEKSALGREQCNK